MVDNWRKKISAPFEAEIHPFRALRGIYLKNQNFRELSLMPGPMVEEMTAERM